MNTHELPTLSPGLLGPQNSSRVILDALADLHFTRQPLDGAREVLSCWAQALSHNEAPQQEVRLLEEGQEIPFAQILGAMDQAQAQRFLAELFEDIVPHFSSQKTFLADLRRGRTQNGMKIDMDGSSQMVLAMLGNLSDEQLAQMSSTHSHTLTWVDDDLRHVNTHVELELGTGERQRSNPRNLHF